MPRENECTVSTRRAFPAPPLVAAAASRYTAGLAASAWRYWRFLRIFEPLMESMSLVTLRQHLMVHFLTYYAINCGDGTWGAAAASKKRSMAYFLNFCAIACQNLRNLHRKQRFLYTSWAICTEVGGFEARFIAREDVAGSKLGKTKRQYWRSFSDKSD